MSEVPAPGKPVFSSHPSNSGDGQEVVDNRGQPDKKRVEEKQDEKSFKKETLGNTESKGIVGEIVDKAKEVNEKAAETKVGF